MEQNWYAVYTRPNKELKISKLLTSKGFEVFCPVNHVNNSNTIQKKYSTEPLFSTYIFVNTATTQLSFLQKIVDVQLVYFRGFGECRAGVLPAL